MPYHYKREPLTADEANRLANACETHEERLIVWTLLDTGLRVNELAKLTRENIDWQSSRLTVYGKGGFHGSQSKRRIVPLSERIKPLIQGHFALHETIGMTPRTIQRMLKRLANRARITRPVSPHVLRHTFAVTALQKGTTAASTVALTQSYRAFHQAALQQEPSSRVRGILTDGFDSTTSSMRTLFPGARLGTCLRHALNKLPAKRTSIASPVRQTLRSQFHTLLYRARQRTGLRVFALGQRLRHFADRVTQSAGEANGARVRRWFDEKKAGWSVVLADPQMPVTSTL
jgi:integrase/recombinase XerD